MNGSIGGGMAPLQLNWTPTHQPVPVTVTNQPQAGGAVAGAGLVGLFPLVIALVVLAAILYGLYVLVRCVASLWTGAPSSAKAYQQREAARGPEWWLTAPLDEHGYPQRVA